MSRFAKPKAVETMNIWNGEVNRYSIHLLKSGPSHGLYNPSGLSGVQY